MANSESDPHGIQGISPFPRFLERWGPFNMPKFDASVVAGVMENPESRMTGRQLMYRVINQLSGSPSANGDRSRLDNDTESEVTHFYKDKFLHVYKDRFSGVSSLGFLINGTYTGRKDGHYEWTRYPDGSMEIKSGNTTYKLSMHEMPQPDRSIITGLQIDMFRKDQSDSVNLNFYPETIKSGQAEVVIPSPLAAKIWAAAVTEVPLEVLFLAGSPLVEFIDPEPRYMDDILDVTVEKFYDSIDMGFGPIDKKGDQTGQVPRSRGGVAVLEKVEDDEDNSDLMNVPLEVRKHGLRDIILTLHYHHKTEMAQKVAGYFNRHAGPKIGKGEEIYYRPEQEKGGVRVSDDVVPQGYTDTTLDPVSYSIVEFVPLEPNQMRK